MQTLMIIVVVQLAVTLLSGCSQDNKIAEHKDTQSKLICQPVDSKGCIGWTK
jgi:outer membrane murein-binding lipoprotein Lpp